MTLDLPLGPEGGKKSGLETSHTSSGGVRRSPWLGAGADYSSESCTREWEAFLVPAFKHALSTSTSV